MCDAVAMNLGYVLFNFKQMFRLKQMKTKDQVAIGAFAADICPEANRASEI